MDSATWGQEQGSQLELCTVVEITGVEWTEREVRQLVRKAVPEQGAHLVDMRTEFNLDCNRALLEWRVAIPTCIQKDVVSLVEGIEAQEIMLLLAGDLEENRSQFGSISHVSEKTDVSAAGLPPASFYIDMSTLFESLVKYSFSPSRIPEASVLLRSLVVRSNSRTGWIRLCKQWGSGVFLRW